jgi:uncharacterized protein YjbJ (UPF0337 family)
MEGLRNQIAGKAHELKGRITNDETEELAGKVQQKKGKLRSKVASAKAQVIAQTEEIVDKALG